MEKNIYIKMTEVKNYIFDHCSFSLVDFNLKKVS